MVMKIQVAVFWIVTPCSDMVGHHCFRQLCCLHLCYSLLGYDPMQWYGRIPLYWTTMPPLPSWQSSGLWHHAMIW